MELIEGQKKTIQHMTDVLRDYQEQFRNNQKDICYLGVDKFNNDIELISDERWCPNCSNYKIHCECGYFDSLHCKKKEDYKIKLFYL
jgi:hypothetical protein